jgi:hypothetical protein
MKHPDVLIGEWAEEHLGVVSLAELLGLGITPDQAERRVNDRRLVVLHNGVYRVRGAPETWHGVVRAAVLAGGEHAYASHHSAMRLFGLRGIYDDRPEITILGTQLSVLRGVRVHRIDRLDRIDTTRRFGIPCLAPPLALLTLGARASERMVHNAVHDAIKTKITSAAKLDDVLRRYGGRGRRGTRKLRNARRSLPASGHATETGLELDGYRLLLAAGLGTPELQYWIVDANGDRRRLDVAYVAERINLEYDHDRWHDPIQDEKRDAAVQAAGWLVRRYDADDVHGNPAPMLREVRRLLIDRSLSTSPRIPRAGRQRTS